MSKQVKKEQSDYFFHFPILTSLVSSVSAYARKKMFNRVMDLAKVGPQCTVLDVGVTNDSRKDSIFFEQLYPYPNRITAAGLEDASFLEERYPGLTFVKVDGKNLPFADKAFDLVVSFAVLEHVGHRNNQRAFLNELCRVGKAVCITTPNRWYPIEFHTLTPFLHWLPPQQFRAILKACGQHFFADEANLNLLTAPEIEAMLPTGWQVRTSHHRLLGPISNLLFYLEEKSPGQELLGQP